MIIFVTFRTLLCAFLKNTRIAYVIYLLKLTRVLLAQTGESLGACVYKKSKSSYAGWHQEVLSADPYIVLFHNVISEEEGQQLMDLSKNLVSVSQLRNSAAFFGHLERLFSLLRVKASALSRMRIRWRSILI